jgi:hypothetical protein
VETNSAIRTNVEITKIHIMVISIYSDDSMDKTFNRDFCPVYDIRGKYSQVENQNGRYKDARLYRKRGYHRGCIGQRLLHVHADDDL